MSSSTGPSGHWPRSCACCAFRGGGSTSAPGRPLCTSLTDIVESRSHVVLRTSRPAGAGVAELRAIARLPAGTAGTPAQARKSAHAPPRWSRCGRSSPHTETNRPHHCPVRDGWAIFPEESGRPRTLREPRACGALLPGWRDRRRSSRATGCPAAPVTDLHLTPTALRNKVNQYGGKCASRFPGQSSFGGCSGRKTTGHGRRNRAM